MRQERYRISPCKTGVVRGNDPSAGSDAKAPLCFLIVDDHALVRYGLSLAIRARFPDARVLEAGSLAAALGTIKTAPHVSAVLYDLQMDDSNETEGLHLMLKAAGDTPLLVVSALNDGETISGCIRAGARGFVPKGCEGTVLDQALPIVLSGGIFAPPPLTKNRGRRPAGDPAETAASFFQQESLVRGLTGRQLQVLRLLLEGQSNKEIARSLGVLEGTVKVHLRTIMQRLGARNRTQLALSAARAGLGTR